MLFKSMKGKELRVFGWVVFAHLILLLILWVQFPEFSFKKLLDIQVELEPSQKRIEGGQPGPSSQASNEAQKDVKKSEQSSEAAKSIPEQSVPSQAASGGANSHLVVPAKDVDMSATFASNPKPAYPPLAFKMRIEGKVLLDVEVAETGLVSELRLRQSSGNQMLDQSAIDAVKKWRFVPTNKDGAMPKQWVMVPIQFQISKR
jgi:protein TonB